MILRQEYISSWRRFGRKLEKDKHRLKMLVLRMAVISAVQNYSSLFETISELFPSLASQEEVAGARKLSKPFKTALVQPLTKHIFSKIEKFEEVTITTRPYQQLLRQYLSNLQHTVLHAKGRCKLRKWLSFRRNAREMKTSGDKFHGIFFERMFFSRVNIIAKQNKYNNKLFQMSVDYHQQYQCWQYLRYWLQSTKRRKMRKGKSLMANNFKSEREQMKVIQCLKVKTFN